jgi:hypothetical protein
MFDTKIDQSRNGNVGKISHHQTKEALLAVFD